MTDQDKTALLSKLRAEGVQAGGFPAYINDDSQPLQYRLGWNNCLSDCRAALASAPVAGEARPERGDPTSPKDDSDRTYNRPIGYLPAYELGRLHSGHDANLRSAKFGPCALDGDVPVYLEPPQADAAPQASEADFADAYEGAREDLAIWKRRALEAERDLRAERETSSRLVSALNAENGPTHMGEPSPQTSEAVHDTALEKAVHALWLMRSRPEFEPDEKDKLLDRAMASIRALKTQANKDGGDCAKGARDVLSNLIWAASERDKGNRIRQFDQFMDEARAAISAAGAERGQRNE